MNDLKLFTRITPFRLYIVKLCCVRVFLFFLSTAQHSSIFTAFSLLSFSIQFFLAFFRECVVASSLEVRDCDAVVVSLLRVCLLSRCRYNLFVSAFTSVDKLFR